MEFALQNDPCFDYWLSFNIFTNAKLKSAKQSKLMAKSFLLGTENIQANIVTLSWVCDVLSTKRSFVITIN